MAVGSGLLYLGQGLSQIGTRIAQLSQQNVRDQMQRDEFAERKRQFAETIRQQELTRSANLREGQRNRQNQAEIAAANRETNVEIAEQRNQTTVELARLNREYQRAVRAEDRQAQIELRQAIIEAEGEQRRLDAELEERMRVERANAVPDPRKYVSDRMDEYNANPAMYGTVMREAGFENDPQGFFTQQYNDLWGERTPGAPGYEPVSEEQLFSQMENVRQGLFTGQGENFGSAQTTPPAMDERTRAAVRDIYARGDAPTDWMGRGGSTRPTATTPMLSGAPDADPMPMGNREQMRQTFNMVRNFQPVTMPRSTRPPIMPTSREAFMETSPTPEFDRAMADTARIVAQTPDLYPTRDQLRLQPNALATPSNRNRQWSGYW